MRKAAAAPGSAWRAPEGGSAWTAWGGPGYGRASTSCRAPGTEQRAGTEAESSLSGYKPRELHGETVKHLQRPGDL